MANSQKHKKNLAMEWLEAEDSAVPTHSRSSHLLGSYVKISKPLPKKKSRPAVRNQKPSKADPSLAREPGSPPKSSEKHSQSASWERQRKLERLTQLRAPYQYKNR